MVQASIIARTRPLLLWFVIAASVLRGIWGIVELVPFLRYLIDGRISSPWFLCLSITIAVAWLVISVGLWALSPWARIAGLVLAGLGIVLGGRAFLLTMMHHDTYFSHYSLMIGFLVLNFIVIACLANPSVKAAFSTPPISPLPPPIAS
jgi:hypothetical protein